MIMQVYKSPHSSGRVSDRLHALRGEDFRHEMNRKGARALRLTTTSTLPTLPSLYQENHTPDASHTTCSQMSRPSTVAGPVPPKGWTERQFSSDVSPDWRHSALVPIFSYLKDPPLRSATIAPLTLLCAQLLLRESSPDQFNDEIALFLPPHVRRDLVRHMAVQDPLPHSTLATLCKGGAASGEVIVVPTGPLSAPSFSTIFEAPSASTDSWESPVVDGEADIPIITVAILRATIKVPVLLMLPATLTCLALVGLGEPVPLFRLTAICPLIQFLDLSFNTWVNDQSLSKVEWRKWPHLSSLGLRECVVDALALGQSVNQSRWQDVVIFT